MLVSLATLALVLPLQATPERPLEVVIPKDAVLSMRLLDPGGLLAGPHGDIWKELLLDEAWISPLAGQIQPLEEVLEEAPDGEPTEVQAMDPKLAQAHREALEATLATCREALIFCGKEEAPDPEAWFALALRGGEDIATPMHRALRGYPQTGPVATPGLGLFRAGHSSYLAGPGLFFLVHHPDPVRAATLLTGFIAALESTETRQDPFSKKGVATERRSDDWEVLLNFTPLLEGGVPLDDPDFAPVQEEIELSLRRLSFAYLAGSIDGAGRWKMRGVLPYGLDTLLGRILEFPLPLEPNAMDTLPPDTNAAVAFGLDLSAVVDWAMEYFPKRYGMTQEDIQAEMKSFETEVGFRMREDFLDLMGPTFLWALGTEKEPAEEQGSTGDNWTLACAIKDRMHLSKSLSNSEEKLNLGPEPVPMEGLNLWTFPFLWSDLYVSLGTRFFAISGSRPTALEMLDRDPAKEGTASLATEPFWKGLQTLPGAEYLQVSRAQLIAGSLSELTGLTLELTGFWDSSIRSPLQTWASALDVHWKNSQSDWHVLQVTFGGGRIEAQVDAF